MRRRGLHAPLETMPRNENTADSPAAFSCEILVLPRSLLQQSLFQLFLALDAVARPWHRFQALGVDLLTAVDTFAETAFADARQRLLHHLQQLALVVALAE